MLASAIQELFSLEVLMALMIGVVGGMVIGAMPGLSASMGVALLIPVTYGMSAEAGLTMLAAVYTSAIYGGSITACLLHTPGTPSSAATAMDGYSLTLRGEGLRAIGMSTVGSMIGGTISFTGQEIERHALFAVAGADAADTVDEVVQEMQFAVRLEPRQRRGLAALRL